mgnify:CR=1 FL=1
MLPQYTGRAHHVTNLYHWQELPGAQVYLPIQTCTPSVSMPMEDPHENRQRTHLNIDQSSLAKSCRIACQSVPLAGAARCPSIPANSDMHAIRQHAHGGPPRKPPKNSPKHRHTSTNPHSQRAAASPARRHLEDHLEENHEELQVVLNAPANDEPKTKSTREAETCSTERRGRPPRSNGLCAMARRNRP